MKIAVIAGLTLALGTTAFAGELVKKDTAKAPVVAGKTMTDADMDKVTAGSGYGLQTANGTYGPGNADASPRASSQGWSNGIGRCNAPGYC